MKKRSSNKKAKDKKKSPSPPTNGGGKTSRLSSLIIVLGFLLLGFGLHNVFLRMPKMISLSSKLQEMINEKNEVETSGALLLYEYERLHCRYHSLLYKQKLLAELKKKALPKIETEITTKAETEMATTITNSQDSNALNESRSNPDIPKLFIAIMSGFGNAATRDIIRTTWANKDHNVETWATIKFAMADPALLNDTTLQNQMYQEQKQYGDMLFLPGVVDHYLTLSERLEAMINFIPLNYDFELFLKTDDDTFLHMDHVKRLITELPRQKLYWGEMVKFGRVIAHPDRLWHNPEYLKVNIHYSIYALGAGYIITRDLMEWVILSPIRFKLWKAEDAQMGTWLSPLRIDVNNTWSRGEIWHSRCERCPCWSDSAVLLHGLMGNAAFQSCDEAYRTGDLCACTATVIAEFKEMRDVRNRRIAPTRPRMKKNEPADAWFYIIIALSVLVSCLGAGLICAFVLNYCDREVPVDNKSRINPLRHSSDSEDEAMGLSYTNYLRRNKKRRKQPPTGLFLSDSDSDSDSDVFN